MSSALKNLSDYNIESVPSGENCRVAIVVAEWHQDITKALAKGAIETLKKHGVSEENIVVRYAPGSFELISACKILTDYDVFDAVIALGCVVRGGTPHFDYICQAVANGLAQLNADQNVPVIFGVLTTDTYEQAQDRAGGKYGNKGDEAAVAALKMASLYYQYAEGIDSDEDEQ